MKAKTKFALVSFMLGLSLALCPVGNTKAAEGDTIKNVSKYWYTDEKAYVIYEDGAKEVFLASDMGYRTFDNFCRNLKLGPNEMKVITPTKYIVVQVDLTNTDADTVDVKVSGAAVDPETEEITTEIVK